MIERFSNNAVGRLSASIDDTDTTITLIDDDGAAQFAVPGAGEFQRATLYSRDAPGVYEIVHITDNNRPDFTVLRGQEGTVAQSWASGAYMGARVTADMLGGFLFQDENGVVRTLPGRPSGSLVLNGRASAGQVQLSGYHVLSLISAAPTTSAGALMQQDRNMTRESVGGTMLVDLGDDVPTWTSGDTYSAYSIVKPPTPDGFMYLFEAADGSSDSQTTTTPAFTGNEFTCDALNGATVVGQWVPIPDPLDFELILGSQNLVVTEVGFICTSSTATTTPVVSIGTDASPTRFASSVSLSQIAGAGDVHRIPVSTGGATADRLAFTLVTPAEGRFVGRFYWRGFFVQLS